MYNTNLIFVFCFLLLVCCYLFVVTCLLLLVSYFLFLISYFLFLISYFSFPQTPAVRLFCDTTERIAVCTIVDARRAHAATIEVQVASIGAILCTTPVVAVAATAAERAIGAEAVASCRQG